MEAFVTTSIRPITSELVEQSELNATIGALIKDLYPVLNDAEEETEIDEKRIAKAILHLSSYPTLLELQTIIDEQRSTDKPIIIEPPSIEPLETFLEKRTITIDEIKRLRASMAKHIKYCKISNTAGTSVWIIGGVLCFFFPTVGISILLAGSATSLGTTITSNVMERRVRKRYTILLEEDILAMKRCESNLRDITTWLVSVSSVEYSESKAGVDFLQLTEAIQASSTLVAWSQLVGQLPSLSKALVTGAKTAATIGGQILAVSVIISVADVIETWVSKNATLEAIDKDIALFEQQLTELKRIAEIYRASYR